VIIATPLELTDISFNIPSQPSPNIPKRKFRTTHATFIKGKLRAKYFKKTDGELSQLSDIINFGKDPIFTYVR